MSKSKLTNSKTEKAGVSTTERTNFSYCLVQICGPNGTKLAVSPGGVLLEDSNGKYTIKATDHDIVNAQFGASTTLRILHDNNHVSVIVLKLAKTADELIPLLSESTPGRGKRTKYPKRRTFTPNVKPVSKMNKAAIRSTDKQETIIHKKALISAKASVIEKADEAQYQKMVAATQRQSHGPSKVPSTPTVAASQRPTKDSLKPTGTASHGMTKGSSTPRLPASQPCELSNQGRTPTIKFPTRAHNLMKAMNSKRCLDSVNEATLADDSETADQYSNDPELDSQANSIPKASSKSEEHCQKLRDEITHYKKCIDDKEEEIVRLTAECDKRKRECAVLREKLKFHTVTKSGVAEPDWRVHLAGVEKNLREHIDKAIVNRESPATSSPQSRKGVVQVTPQVELPSKNYIDALKAKTISVRINRIIVGYWPDPEVRDSLYFHISDEDDVDNKRLITDEEVADILEICKKLQEIAPRDGGNEADLVEGDLFHYISRKLVGDRNRRNALGIQRPAKRSRKESDRSTIHGDEDTGLTLQNKETEGTAVAVEQDGETEIADVDTEDTRVEEEQIIDKEMNDGQIEETEVTDSEDASKSWMTEENNNCYVDNSDDEEFLEKYLGENTLPVIDENQDGSPEDA